MKMARSFALVLLAVLFAGAVGTASATAPVPQHVSVIKLTHMDIMRNGQPSGRLSLAVGTALDVDGVDGDFVLVHIRLLKGRVPAVDTDFDTMAAAPEGSRPQRAAPSLQESASPTTPPSSANAAPSRAASPPAASAATPVAAAPWKMDPGYGSGPRARRPGAKLGLTFYFFFAAFCVFMVAAHWRLYAKAGKPGWAALVPIYNMFVYLQIAGKPLWWFILYFVPVVNVVISIMSIFAVAGKFGKGTGFALGMLFLPFIFVPILAFGDDPYLG
jgi:hypothetical protein